jgi:pimeloyl-ACP methyl ester carboxylesterase
MGIDMKKTFTRRIVAAVAAAGLLLVAAPAFTPAQAATGCALASTCEGALTGSLGSTTFKIQMPSKFNGTVLVWNHGYRISTPIPAALAVPLGLASSASYQKISFPAFAATFGTDVAYIGSGAAEVAQNDVIAQQLLAQGYALSGVGYARQGWASPEAVQADELLFKHINAGAISGVKKTVLWGESFGGFVSATVAERNPGKVAGLLPTCGALAGPEVAMANAMTVMYTWKSLIAPTLRVANYTSYAQALTDLATVLQTLGGVAAGTVSTSAVGYPVAQANLLGGLMAGEPTVSSVYDGVTVNPAFGTLGTAAALAGGYQPASAGGSTAVAMLQNVGAAAALGIMVRYDLEQRARLVAGIPADQSANFTDNVNVAYTNLLTDEQRGEFGDTLNASTVMPNLLNAMLAKMDSTKGNAAARFPASAAALKAVRSLPAPKGVYTVPTVLIADTYDPIVPAGNTDAYFTKLMASAKAKGAKPLVAQYYTVPPADGWTTFAPGAKSPDAAASAAKATSGVGHCNWTIGNGIQVVNAVGALNRIISNPSTKGVKNANKLMWSTVGVNGDGAFQPPALPRPNLTAK